MSDPFLPSADKQLYREAQYGMAVLACLIALFVYLAVIRITGRNYDIPQSVQGLPASAGRDFAQSPTQLAQNSNGYAAGYEPSSKYLSAESSVGVNQPYSQVPSAPLQRFPQFSSDRANSFSTQTAGSIVDRGSVPANSGVIESRNKKLESQRKLRNPRKLESQAMMPNPEFSKTEFVDLSVKKSERALRIEQAARELEGALSTIETRQQALKDHFASLQVTQPSNAESFAPIRSNLASENGFAAPKIATSNTINANAPKDDGFQAVSANEPVRQTLEPAGFAPSESENRDAPSPAMEKAGEAIPKRFLPLPKLDQSLASKPTTIVRGQSPEMPIGQNELRSQAAEGLSNQAPTFQASRPIPAEPVSVIGEVALGNSFESPPLPIEARGPEPMEDALEFPRVKAEGDESFYTLAQAAYDDGRYFRALYRFNKASVASADGIPQGTYISIPPMGVLKEKFPEDCPPEDSENILRNGRQGTARALSSRIYVTKEGDTLFGIARDRLGQAYRYLEIKEKNEAWLTAESIGEEVSDLTRLPAGIRLVLPWKSVQ